MMRRTNLFTVMNFYVATVSVAIFLSPSLAATVTFTPIGATTVDAGTDIVMVLSVTAVNLASFDAADIIIGSNDANDIAFTYDPAWTSAFSNTSTPLFDVGFYNQDVFVGGNNITSVGSTLVLGTITVNTTGMSGGLHQVVVDNAIDNFSRLALAGVTESLSGSGSFQVIAPLQSPAPLTGEAGFTKDRYISINPTTNGNQAAAIRVTRVGSMTNMFVDCTSLQDAGADGWYAKLHNPAVALPAPGDTAYYCDWSGVTSGLHIRGCSVVPGNIYNVAMTIDGVEFSAASPIPTTSPQSPPRAFGDTVGSLIGNIWTEPDGIVTTSDIVAAVRKFGLDPDAAIMARIDTEGDVPNAVISSGDILRGVRAFAGDDFGSGVTDCKLGQCIPPQAGACE